MILHMTLTSPELVAPCDTDLPREWLQQNKEVPFSSISTCESSRFHPKCWVQTDHTNGAGFFFVPSDVTLDHHQILQDYLVIGLPEAKCNKLSKSLIYFFLIQTSSLQNHHLIVFLSSIQKCRKINIKAKGWNMKTGALDRCVIFFSSGSLIPQLQSHDLQVLGNPFALNLKTKVK